MKQLFTILCFLICVASNAQVVVFGIDVTPITPASTLAVTQTSLSGFSTTEGAASSYQTFTLTGNNLTENVYVAVSAGSGFAVSLSSGSGYGSPVIVTPTDGSINSTIYVRITASASVGSLTGDVSITSIGATTKNVTVSGTVTAPTPSITASSTSLTGFTTIAGTASSAQSFTVSGSNLTGNITVTAPTDYEVSLSLASGYASSVAVTQSSGSASETIYGRIKSTASAGSPTGNITCTSTGATTKNISVSGTVTSGSTDYDTIQINLYSSAGGSYSDAAWNNVNITTPAPTSEELNKTTGAATNITLTATGLVTYTSNGAEYGASNTMGFPKQVLDYTAFNNSTSPLSLVFNNCDAHTYKIRIACVRNTATTYVQKFTYAGTDYTVTPTANLTNVVEIDNLIPVSGTITIPFSRVTGTFLFVTAIQLIDTTP